MRSRSWPMTLPTCWCSTSRCRMVLAPRSAQASGELSEVPILLLSPPDAQRERLLALNAGADDYVAKPFRRQELLDRLSGVGAGIG